ncbi:hypothetical protein [Algoriphagus formosus]|uniref:hypothetical protein n=1 Tax=Algoriphagus formosus TaxID=2007308 RepID=UPI003F72EC86
MSLSQAVDKSFLFWALGLFLGLGIIWFLPWRFQTNDDVMMMWLVSGAYTGEPEPYAVFIHPWLSWSFSKIYGLIPETNWYGLTWFSVNFLSAFLLLKKVWISAFPKIQKNFWSLVIWLISFHFAFFPQFTLIAGLAALAGLLKVFDTKSKGFNTLGYVVLFMSFSIRFEAAVLVGLGWTWFILVFQRQKVLSLFKPLIFTFSVAAFLFVGKWGYEKLWVDQEYLDFNKARSGVHDHPVFFHEMQDDLIPQDSDWFYFGRWIYEELPISTGDLIEKERQLNQKLYSGKAIIDGFRRIFQIQSMELFKSLLIVLLLTSFLISKLTLQRKVIFIAVWISFFLVFNHFNMLYGRVNILFFLILIFPCFDAERLNISNLLLKISLAALVGLFSLHILNFHNEMKRREKINENLTKILKEQQITSPIYFEDIMEYHFTDHYSQNRPVPFISSVWISRSSMQEKAYELRGFARQSELKEFYILSFQSPEPLIFPDYMNRISPGFQIQSKQVSANLILLHYKK